MKKIFAFLFFFMYSMFSHSSSVDRDFTILMVGISEDTDTILVEINESQNDSQCDLRRSFRYPISEVNNSYYKEIYSTLLIAYTTKKTVRIGFTIEPEFCILGSPQIRKVFLR